MKAFGIVAPQPKPIERSPQYRIPTVQCRLPRLNKPGKPGSPSKLILNGHEKWQQYGQSDSTGFNQKNSLIIFGEKKVERNSSKYHNRVIYIKQKWGRREQLAEQAEFQSKIGQASVYTFKNKDLSQIMQVDEEYFSSIYRSHNTNKLLERVSLEAEEEQLTQQVRYIYRRNPAHPSEPSSKRKNIFALLLNSKSLPNLRSHSSMAAEKNQQQQDQLAKQQPTSNSYRPQGTVKAQARGRKPNQGMIKNSKQPSRL